MTDFFVLTPSTDQYVQKNGTHRILIRSEPQTLTRVTFYSAAMSHYVNERNTIATRNHLQHYAAILADVFEHPLKRY